VLDLPAPGGQLAYALRGWTADNEVLYSENRRSAGGGDVAEFWVVSSSARGNRRRVFAIDRGTGAARVSNVTPDGRQIVIVAAAGGWIFKPGTEKISRFRQRIFIQGSVRTPDQCGFDAALALINLRFSASEDSSSLRDDFLTKRVDRSGRPPL
jgi:hypothetical protein